jgi:glycosyltransferase involved in cell wall biosynthesis
MTAAAPSRVLVLATGPMNAQLAGPEIRALEFAKALRQDCEVTLAAQREDRCERAGLPVIPARRRRILSAAARHDVVISPAVPPYLLALKSALGIATISDQYDPYELELVALRDEKHDRELRTRAVSQALTLRHADLVLCASARQREQLIAEASRLGAGEIDPVVVPFGIPDPPPASGRRPLRERFPQIADGDTIVFWWGTVWKWLDAETAIRAFAALAAARPDVKLVITAGRPPNRNNQRFEATEDAVRLARELGVLDRNVLFLEDWIAYDERHDYLRDATIGLTLHRFSGEAHLAARARYMDYLAAELPCVLGRGDETAAEFEAAGFATLLDRGDPELLAATLLALIDDPGRLERARAAGERLAAERRWSAVGERLRAAVSSIGERPALRERGGPSLVASTGTYYGRRAVEMVAEAVR